MTRRIRAGSFIASENFYFLDTASILNRTDAQPGTNLEFDQLPHEGIDLRKGKFKKGERLHYKPGKGKPVKSGLPLGGNLGSWKPLNSSGEARNKSMVERDRIQATRRALPGAQTRSDRRPESMG